MLPWHISALGYGYILALLLRDALAVLAIIVRRFALLSVVHRAMHLLFIVTLLVVDGVALLGYFEFTLISAKKITFDFNWQALIDLVSNESSLWSHLTTYTHSYPTRFGLKLIPNKFS